MVVKIQNELPNTTFRSFGKDIFNEKAIDQIVHLIFDKDGDNDTDILHGVGSKYLYNVRNLIFKQNDDSSIFKYGYITTLKQKSKASTTPTRKSRSSLPSSGSSASLSPRMTLHRVDELMRSLVFSWVC